MNQGNDALNTRFSELRLKELKGTLTAAETEQLANLFKQLEDEEAAVLAPAVAAMRAEQVALRQRLLQAQTENEELASLLNQQEQLVTEARQWLAEFTSRHTDVA